MSDFSRHVTQFDDEFTTERPEGAGNFKQLASLDALPDGNYTFVIREASAELIKGTPVVRLKLFVNGGLYEHIYWLGNQTAVNMLGQAFVTLRVLPESFTGKFSQVIEKCVARLAGIKATGKKGTKQGDTKDFVTFYWQSVIGREEVPASQPQPAPQRPQPARTPTRQQPLPAQAQGSYEAFPPQDDDDIPF